MLIILIYIIENGYITNKICREELGFGKTKSIDLFNKLKDRRIIKRTGSGSKIKYILDN